MPLIRNQNNPSAITAAATPTARSAVNTTDFHMMFGDKSNVKVSDKQKSAWKAYNNVGEIHFLASGVIGAAIETLSWYGGSDDLATTYSYVPPIEEMEGYSESDAQVVRDLIASLKPNWGTQQDFMRTMAINLLIAGECFHYHKHIGGKWKHEVLTKEAIKTVTLEANGKTKQTFIDPVETDPDGKDKVVNVGDKGELNRIWRPHPAKPRAADSPMFAILSLLDELMWIQKLMDALVRQRIMVSGILIVPNTSLGPDYNPNDQDSIAGSTNAFQAEMLKQMSRAIDEDSSAPAMPLVMFTSPEDADAFKHISFDSEISEQLIRERDKVMRRIANSLDVPSEFVLGIGEVNHWSAWLLRDLLWQQHIKPMATLIANSITTTFLRPALYALKAKGQFDGDPEGVKLWYESSESQTHPDRFQFLLDAYDHGIIGPKAILQSLGIPPNEAITEEEFELWLSLKMNGSGAAVEEGEVGPDGTTKEPAPSRQRTGDRRKPESKGADRSRSKEGGPTQR